MNNNQIKVGISLGDPNGIGAELIIKTFTNQQILRYCTPIIYGSTNTISFYKKVLGYESFEFNRISSTGEAEFKTINIIDCWSETAKIIMGQASSEAGGYAIKALEAATKDLKSGKIDCLVTLPINKKTVKESGFKFIGHTEYLKDYFDIEENLMLMVSQNLRVAVATGHIPLSKVASTLTTSLIIKKAKLLNKSLIKDFGILKPKIAVLGVNPHAGDNGAIGNDESDTITPAIELLKKDDIFCFGPFSSDGFFGSLQYQKYDGILAMYHDQGLGPFKALAFDTGVNFTAGMPVVRTSPDHGPAYEISGKNIANESSFRNSIFTAIDIVRYRASHKDMIKSPLNREAINK
jgi:4-hydroxythreonine-4-phosphate dehydrogenase